MDNILNLVTEHAQQFEDYSKTTVVPLSNTPLSDLCAAYQENPDSYEATLSGIADFLADRMALTMDFTRNTVKPAIEKIMEGISEGLSALRHDPFEGFIIEEVDYPEILEEEDFMIQVQSFVGQYVAEPKIFPKLPSKTDKEIKELISTGNGRWDEKVDKWLSKQPEDTLQNVWKSFFQEKGTAHNVKTVEEVLKDFNQGGFSALLVYLIANRMRNSGVSDDFGMKLDEARKWLYDLCRLACSNINIGVQRYNNLTTAGQVIVSTNQMEKKIRVNKAMYKQYLSKGGKADALMGLLVSKINVTSLRELESRNEELIKVWNFYIQSRQAEALTTFERQARSIIYQVFESELGNPINEQEADMVNQTQFKKQALDIFRKELDQLPKSAFANQLQDHLWRPIVKARFYYNTTAYEILDLVDYHVGQGQDPKDASTIAYETVVSNFVCEMMKTVKSV